MRRLILILLIILAFPGSAFAESYTSVSGVSVVVGDSPVGWTYELPTDGAWKTSSSPKVWSYVKRSDGRFLALNYVWKTWENRGKWVTENRKAAPIGNWKVTPAPRLVSGKYYGRVISQGSRMKDTYSVGGASWNSSMRNRAWTTGYIGGQVINKALGPAFPAPYWSSNYGAAYKGFMEHPAGSGYYEGQQWKAQSGDISYGVCSIVEAYAELPVAGSSTVVNYARGVFVSDASSVDGYGVSYVQTGTAVVGSTGPTYAIGHESSYDGLSKFYINDGSQAYWDTTTYSSGVVTQDRTTVKGEGEFHEKQSAELIYSLISRSEVPTAPLELQQDDSGGPTSTSTVPPPPSVEETVTTKFPDWAQRYIDEVTATFGAASGWFSWMNLWGMYLGDGGGS